MPSLNLGRVRKVLWDLAYRTIAPWDTGVPPKELIEVINTKAMDSGARIIDLGCGSGGTAIYLGSKGYEVTGIDISPTAISKSLEKVSRYQPAGRVRFINTDLFEFCVENKFDVAIDVGLYHSLNKNLRSLYPKHLKECVLRSGGDLLLWVRKPGKLDVGPPYPISISEIREGFIESNNYSLVKIKETMIGSRIGIRLGALFVWFKLR